MPDDNKRITGLLLSQGASLIGFADLREIDGKARHHLPFGITIAVALDPLVISGILNGPTAEYHRQYRSANSRLAELAGEAAVFIQQQGYHAIACHPTIGEDEATLATKLPHKTVATRAGMGWIGKCALLITEEFGSAVRLTTVLTDAPVTTGVPVNDSRCGDCIDCVEACPAGAVTGADWQTGVPREALVDAHACRKTARERTFQSFGERVSICGICIVACPWTQRYLSSHA